MVIAEIKMNKKEELEERPLCVYGLERITSFLCVNAKCIFLVDYLWIDNR